jgi:hypothetical protein
MLFTVMIFVLLISPILGAILFFVESYYDKKFYENEEKESWKKWEIENEIVLSTEPELREKQINHVLNW